MKIGLISDIHANLHALKQVLQALDERDIDLILCAGDLVCYGAYPNQVVHLLTKRHIPCVIGNYDDAVAYGLPSASRKPSSPATEPIKQAALDWTKKHATPSTRLKLKSLPWMARYRLDGMFVNLLHAGPDHLDEWLVPEDPASLDNLAKRAPADVIVLGHTHQAFAAEQQGVLFINPGAVGRSLDGDVRASYAIFDTATRQVTFERVAYDIEAAAKAIYIGGMPPEIASLVRCGVRRIEEVTYYENS